MQVKYTVVHNGMLPCEKEPSTESENDQVHAKRQLNQNVNLFPSYSYTFFSLWLSLGMVGLFQR
jgi:hypothetical protein